MSKFDRVLSDDDADSIIKNTTMLLGQSISRSKDLILKVEQAVLAKLAEQEPVMYARTYYGEIDWDEACVTEKNDGALMHATDMRKEDFVRHGYAVIPLYTHPTPCVSNARDKTACVSENVESDKQELPPLPNPNCRSPNGIGYFDSFTKDQMIDYAKNAIEHHRTTKNHIADKRKMVDVDHIPDIGQMVPEEKTIEQHRAEFEAHWHNIQSHGLDNGWLGDAWAAWKAARGGTE